MSELLEEAVACEDWIVGIRRELHQYPELMYEEIKTGSVVRRVLSELGIPFQFPIAQTGIVATIGGGDGPCIALRAEMDALPITEQADVEFRSQVSGRMHACGHDCHTAMLLGAARLLKRREAEIRGTIKLLFQPAEEGGAGGLRMCEEGVLAAPAVQRAFGLHVSPYLPTGHIGSRPGTFLAAASVIDITVIGTGGHAAMPHTTVDPIATAAAIVGALQTIVSRETDPLDGAVVTISTIHGGDALNVIPPEVKMAGTIRSLTSKGLRTVQERVQKIATQVAAAYRCTARVEFPGNDYPATVNDAPSWRTAQIVASEILGSGTVHEVAPVMVGEDFAYVLERVPGCLIALGIRNERIGAVFGVHDPKFVVDERALPIGVALHVGFALRTLAELGAS